MRTSYKESIKNNRGYTGIDLSVSIMIILISVSVIATMVYNLYFTGAGMKRNVIATNYAINILETIQATDYSLVTFNNEEDENLQLKNTLDNLLKTNGSINNNKYINNLNDYYNITITIEKYQDRFPSGEKEDYIKIITVSIDYNLGKKSNKDINNEKLEISTLKTIK